MSIEINKGDKETLETPYGFVEYHEIWSEAKHVGWTTGGFLLTMQKMFRLAPKIEALIKEVENPQDWDSLMACIKEIYKEHKFDMSLLEVQEGNQE